MELILISDSKLKIMLTADDMADYSISNEYMSYESKDTRKMFGRILEEARQKTGFDSSNERLFIQVYPSKNGGCEVYVTTFEEGEMPQKKNEKKNNAPKKKKEYCVYTFDNIEDVTQLCKILRKSGYKFESSLHYENGSLKKKRYFLVLQEEVLQNNQYRKRKNVNKSDLANEYGKRIECKDILFYIGEHTEKIIKENAVNVLSKF